VDHVIGDPEYNEDTHEGARSSGQTYGDVQDIGINFAPVDDVGIAREWIRIAKRWVVVFCALEQLGDYRRVAGQRKKGGSWVRSGIWDRTDGTPQLSGDRPGQSAEGIAIMSQLGEADALAIMHRSGKMEWNGGGKRAIWRCGVERRERYGHKTPKPTKLMLDLVLDFTKRGDLILDPRAGDGTTGVACLRSDRKVILCERDPRAAQVCRERMEAESRFLDLGSARSPQRGLF
jgi:site-specific DNA-methyltransferase (adenine-specific)